jgi:hypothetical protein
MLNVIGTGRHCEIARVLAVESERPPSQGVSPSSWKSKPITCTEALVTSAEESWIFGQQLRPFARAPWFCKCIWHVRGRADTLLRRWLGGEDRCREERERADPRAMSRRGTNVRHSFQGSGRRNSEARCAEKGEEG